MEPTAPPPAVVSPVLAVAGFVGVAFGTVWIRSGSTDGRLVAVAAAWALLLLAAAALVPWRRLPLLAVLVLPLGCDVLVGLLRHAQGGTQSGYTPLLVLPAVWVAFVAGRRGTVAAAAATAATLVVPILLVGGARYPATGWRLAALMTLVVAIVGLVTEHGVAETRRRAAQLDRLLRMQTAIAMSDFAVDDILATVVQQALELTRADAAVVELPEDELLVYRAVAGAAAPFEGLRLPVAGSLSGRCLREVEPVVVRDAELDDRADVETCRLLGARSLVVVPLVHGGAAAGVLKVYSASPGAVGPDEARVLGLLGHVIGTGLVRAEHLETLAEHARTDALTGLANRRSWDDQLGRALAQAARAQETVSVAVCDVDGLKALNDRRGHAAGDALLRAVAEHLGRGARAADLLARIGGDEFAMLLPGADKEAAEEVVARLTRALPPGCAVSVGVAEWDGRESGATLVARADARMYEQKRARATAVAAG